MNLKEAAEYSGMPKAGLLREIKSGKIKAIKAGGWRIRRSDLEQLEEELLVFRHFVQVARLPVIPESIEKRYPPEPDVHCRLSHGEQVAFELVEICNPGNARFMGSADKIYSLAMSAYHSLPPSARSVAQPRFQLRHVLPHVLPQPAIASQDQPGQSRSYYQDCNQDTD